MGTKEKPVIPALGERGQGDQEFTVSLNYMRLCLSQKTEKKNDKEI